MAAALLMAFFRCELVSTPLTFSLLFFPCIRASGFVCPDTVDIENLTRWTSGHIDLPV
jgi:hypothetical protein